MRRHERLRCPEWGQVGSGGFHNVLWWCTVNDPAKRTRALLGSNPPRNSRCKLTAMRLGRCASAWRPFRHSCPWLIAVDLPMPQKPIAQRVRSSCRMQPCNPSTDRARKLISREGCAGRAEAQKLQDPANALGSRAVMALAAWRRRRLDPAEGLLRVGQGAEDPGCVTTGR